MLYAEGINGENRISAFTLLEVMVTLAVLTVLSSIAIPAISKWLPNYRLRMVSRDLISNFRLAKFTAIKANTNCTVTFHQTIGFQEYDYVVFIDTDKDLEYDDGEELLVRKLLTDDGSIDFDDSDGGGDGVTFSNNDDGIPAVAFQYKGFPISNTGALGMGSVFLKNINNKEVKIALSREGNIHVHPDE